MRTSLVPRVLHALVLLFILTPRLAAQQVWTVGPAGEATFESIQPAVDAAADGDVIVVFGQPGVRYPSFVIDDKSLTLVGTTPSTATCGTIRIRDLSAGKRVSIRRLHPRGVSASSPIQGHGVWLSHCAGAIRFEECVIAGYLEPCEPPDDPSPGIEIQDCDDVALSDCEITGGAGGAWDPPGCVAIHSSSSQVALFGVDAVGSTYECNCASESGCAGVVLEDASLLIASGGTIHGSDGFSPAGTTCYACGEDGGAGLVVAPGSSAWLSDVHVAGGAGGEGNEIATCNGSPGWPILGGPVQILTSPLRALETPPLMVQGDRAMLRFFGEPGDRAYLLWSRQAGFAPMFAWSGVLALKKPFGLGPFEGEDTSPFDWGSSFLGIVPASGVLAVPLEALEPAGESDVLLVQALAVSATGVTCIGQPSQLLVVDVVHPFPDCNSNDIDDAQDVASGSSLDCDADGVPDECQEDCNENGVPDACDLLEGSSLDVNHDGIADECQFVRRFVDHDAPPGGNGMSWATAHQQLRHALAVETPGWFREIWVAEGHYLPVPAGSPDVDACFRLADGDVLFGGFAGRESSADERDPAAHPTVLSGDLHQDDLPDFGNRADNSQNVVIAAGAFVLDGFEVRGGYSTSTLTGSGGGGLRAYDVGIGRVVSCRFLDNHGREGGGAYLRCADLVVAGCEFIGNRSVYQGGALEVRAITGPASVVDCAFFGNRSGWDGGAVSLYVSSGRELEVVNCTVASNVCVAQEAGGIGIEGHAAVRLSNCILWGNEGDGGATEDQQIGTSSSGSFDLSYSCIEGLASLPGAGNHGLDPRFVDLDGPDGVPGTTDDDLRLQPTSPCIDAGRNAFLPADLADLDRDGDFDERLPLDLDLAPRQVDVPSVPDTGSGQPPLVDMGAYERQVP